MRMPGVNCSTPADSPLVRGRENALAGVNCPTPSDSPFVRGRENAHAGDMRRRWCVAGLLRAESKFRRVKGHRAMTALLEALEGSAGRDRLEPDAASHENGRQSRRLTTASGRAREGSWA
jgi:hypothetical protein